MGLHLAQAAGFITGRHPPEVAAGQPTAGAGPAGTGGMETQGGGGDARGEGKGSGARGGPRAGGVRGGARAGLSAGSGEDRWG